MKRVLNIILIALALVPVLGGCKRKPHLPQEVPHEKQVLAYTCSMHPWVRSDKPGLCPVCGMNLVPLYSEGEAATEPIHAHAAEPPSAGSQMTGEASPQEKKILYYVDPMHPWYKSDKPGKAPDCGMDLVPVYDEAGGGAEQGEIAPDLGRVSVKVSLEKQQLIGVRTAEVKRQRLTREIDATGRVAFDPDLYVAQSDYLIARRTGGGDLGGLQGQLVQAARSRLRLLGMSDGQIRDLERRGKPMGSLVVPQAGEGVWVYGAIFENEIPWVKVGDAVQVLIPGSQQTFDTNISSIDPTINPSTRTAQVRLSLSNNQGELRPDMYVKLKIRAEGEAALTVPEDALIETGKRQIVYVQTGEGRFAPKVVKVGRYGTGMVEILSGLNEGEKVVTNGNFLIDSESSLKATLSGGTGGHQH